MRRRAELRLRLPPRLVPGHMASSYGIHCARMAGVPAPVLDRAADILDTMAAGEPLRATRADPRLAARNARCTRMVQALIDFDVDAGDLRAFLEEVCAISAEGYDEEEPRAAGEAGTEAAQMPRSVDDDGDEEAQAHDSR